MRTLVTLAALTLATAAHAASEMETLERYVGRAGASAYCICRTDDAYNNLVGALSAGTALVGNAWRVRAYCYVPDFASDGHKTGAFQCQRFEILDR